MRLKSKISLSAYFLTSMILFLSACAVQQTPTGGERDMRPPKLLSVSPANETVNFNAEEIVIEFDEYIQLKDAFQEITVSPDPETRPEFRTKKNAIVVKFTDTLEENTTYQINFGKSIADMNEGNPYANYKYVFSTGNQIDSLSIGGSVVTYDLAAKVDVKSPEPLNNILVLLHPDQDSLVLKKKPGYYTLTDSSGNFRITNLKEGTYRVYALKEENGSRIYDDNDELIGFLQEPLRLTGDTLLEPLQLAKMEHTQLEVLNDKSQDARLSLVLNKRPEKLDLRVLFPENFKDKLIVEQEKTNDSVIVWFPTFQYDSVKVAIGENGSYVDTLLIRNFTKKEKLDPFGITDNFKRNSALKPGDNPQLIFSRPVNDPELSGIELQEDSVKVPLQALKLERLSPRRYSLHYNWKEKSGYQITIGAGFMSDIYGAGNQAYQRQFKADTLENYGNIFIEYKITDSLPDSTQYIVQLLNVDNTIIKEDILRESKRIEYRMLEPAAYIIRVIYDRNRNNRWDGTNLLGKVQPEKILLFNPGENLRANWDQEYSIEIPPEGNPEDAKEQPSEGPESEPLSEENPKEQPSENSENPPPPARNMEQEPAENIKPSGSTEQQPTENTKQQSSKDPGDQPSPEDQPPPEGQPSPAEDIKGP